MLLKFPFPFTIFPVRIALHEISHRSYLFHRLLQTFINVQNTMGKQKQRRIRERNSKVNFISWSNT